MAMVNALRARGHDVAWVRTDAPGIPDEEVLATAVAEHRVLVTADKDFGELAFRQELAAVDGIMLLRMRGSPARRHATLVAAVTARDDWAGHFSVIEDDRIRMTRLPA